MSLSGPDTLRALDDALRDMRVEEDDVLRKLARTAERIAKIRVSEAELMQQFAVGRISAETEARLRASATAAAARWRSAARTHDAGPGGATSRQADIDRDLNRLVTERHAALTAVDRQQAELRHLAPRIAAAISRDPAYGLQKQRIANLRSIAAAAQAKAHQAMLDRDQRALPYRTDKLFGYLAARGYSTPAYRERSLLAPLDGWVAGLTGYDTAAEHLRMIDALPGLLQAHADRQLATAAAADAELDAIERAAIDAAGGAAIRAALADTQGRIEAIDRQIRALQDERDPTALGQAALAAMTDSDFAAATHALAQSLGYPTLAAAIASSRMGSGAESPVLTQLQDVRQRVIEEMTDARDNFTRLKTLGERRRALENIEYEFKSSKYDDPRSIFADEALTGAQLTGFLSGTLTAQGYWQAISRAHAWSEGTAGWGGGIGLPRHGRQPEASVQRVAGDSFSQQRAGEPSDAA